MKYDRVVKGIGVVSGYCVYSAVKHSFKAAGKPNAVVKVGQTIVGVVIGTVLGMAMSDLSRSTINKINAYNTPDTDKVTYADEDENVDKQVDNSDRIIEVSELLRKASKAYYSKEDAEIMSNLEYDRLQNELDELLAERRETQNGKHETR